MLRIYVADFIKSDISRNVYAIQTNVEIVKHSHLDTMIERKTKYFIDLSTEWRKWDDVKSIHERRWIRQVNEISCHHDKSIHERRWMTWQN